MAIDAWLKTVNDGSVREYNREVRWWMDIQRNKKTRGLDWLMMCKNDQYC